MHSARNIACAFTALLLLCARQSAAAADEPPPSPPSEPGKDIKIDDHHEEQKRTEEPGAPSPARQEMEPASEPPKKEDESDPDEKKFTLSGYVETFYQYNFNNPGNGISNYRGYDNRHNAFTLSNAVLDAGFRAKNLLGRLALQIGHSPATYYAQEPNLGGGDGAGESDDKLWRYLQRASVGWQASKAILFEAGLFLTNIGVESLVVKDNWNYSRTTASTRLPNYSTGVKGTWHATDRLDVMTGVFNGWNTILDNNDEKSILVQAQYKVKEAASFSAAYYGGVERPGGAVEGRPWRHAFDLYAQISATDWLEVAGEGNGGFEDGRFGFHWFAGTAAYARANIPISIGARKKDALYLALRGDRLWEDFAANDRGTASPILLPAKHITSGTATIDLRPVKGLSVRLEYKYDVSNAKLFFRSSVEGDGKQTPYVPNARSQNTLLLGVVGWF